MRIEYEKLFASPDELVDFRCKSNEEQGWILAKLHATDKNTEMKLYCQTTSKKEDKTV